MKKLEGFRLDGVVQKIRCPFLLLHGEGDEQIPLSLAQQCFDAVGSANKTFKVFTREEGGFHHCQVDHLTIGTNYMSDWLADVVTPGRRGGRCPPSLRRSEATKQSGRRIRPGPNASIRGRQR